MALHTSGIIWNIGHPFTPDKVLGVLGLRGSQAEQFLSVGAALALSSDDSIAIACVNSWNLVFGSALFMPMVGADGKEIPMGPGFCNQVVQEKLTDLSESGAKIFTFIAEGASMTYGHEWYDKSLKRRYLEVDGDVVTDEGSLAGEAEIFEEVDDKERRIWLLMEPRTLTFNEANTANYTHFLGVSAV